MHSYPVLSLGFDSHVRLQREAAADKADEIAQRKAAQQHVKSRKRKPED